MATRTHRSGGIVIGRQPEGAGGRTKTRRQRTQEMLPRRLENVLDAVKGLHTFANPNMHELKPVEQRRVTETILKAVQDLEDAWGPKGGKLAPKIFED